MWMPFCRLGKVELPRNLPEIETVTTEIMEGSHSCHHVLPSREPVKKDSLQCNMAR